MRTAMLGFVVAFLACSPVLAQQGSLSALPQVTGSAIPDAAAWRIWLNMKSEPPGNHSEAFTTYLASLNLPLADAATLQGTLESYATKSSVLIVAANAKIDAADETGDAVAATTTLNALETQLAALVTSTQLKLSSNLSSQGVALLTNLMQREKGHMTISPTDVSLAQTGSVIVAEPAAYRASRSPQPGTMQPQYSSYASSWISVTGNNSNGNPYGTFYQQLGLEGTTNPCYMSCPYLIHTSYSSYTHAGVALGTNQLSSQHANTYMNGAYTYSWPFDADTNSFWSNESGWVWVHCSSNVNISGSNPVSPGSGSNPFQSELATTYTTIPVVFRCANYPSCNTVFDTNPYCFLTPDYTPINEPITIPFGDSVLEFKQYASCERVGSGVPWSCYALYSNDRIYSATLVPPAGGAACSHHP